MRAKFTTNKFGYVTLSYDIEDYDGVRRVERIFICPADGGYVREHRHGGWKQVCDHLSYMGSTLFCPRRDDLPAMIHREYQTMRRAEKRGAGQSVLWS